MNAVLIGAGGVAAASGFLAYAARGRSASVFGSSVYHGDRQAPAIALTFDDGPSESTPALLDILAKHNVAATFFMCGANVRRCRDSAREVAKRGHEIGNHTDSHPRLDFKSAEFIYGELSSAQETICAVTGATPAWFRAPYGVRWFGLGAAQRRLGLTGVMWTTIARDWRLPAEGIENRLLENAANGAIFCLHDGRRTLARPDIRAMLEAVDRTIPRLQERGFHFETLTGLLCQQMLCPKT